MFVLFIYDTPVGAFLFLANAKIILKNGITTICNCFLDFCNFIAVSINEQSPCRLAGRLLVKGLDEPLVFLSQLLDVCRFLHIYFVAIPVVEMVFKVCQFLVGYDADSESVFHLPFTVE